MQIYLDFVGAPAMQWGGYSVPATPAYDVNGDPTTFTGQELVNIQEIWAQVAEAYSPFDVNVTTVAPSTYAYKQTVWEIIGGSSSWTDQTIGGISYTGSFASPLYGPNISFVFPNDLSYSNTAIADSAAHEAGHEFGLSHQSVYSGTTLVSEYNYGTAASGPIMGDPYSDARALWWYGQSDVSSTTIQNDIDVIADSTNGFGFAPEDHGQTIATADALAVSGTSVSQSGIISQLTDTDTFSFTTAAGAITLNVNVAEFGPMLHAEALLENASGTVIATADNANTLGQTISTTVPAGTYYLVVESDQHAAGIVEGEGYDLGSYNITGNVVASAPVVSIAGGSSVNEQANYTLSLSASDPGNTITSWTINWGDGNTQTVAGSTTNITHDFGQGPATYTVSATAIDSTATTYTANTLTVSVLHVTPTLTLTGNSTVNEQSLYTLSLAAVETAGHAISAWSINWGDGDTQAVSGDPSSVTHTYASGTHAYTIQATATDDVGTYTAGDSVTITVEHVPPTLSISGPSTVAEQTVYTLTLSGSETDSGHSIADWTITWGDGTVQNLSGDPSSATHTYAAGPHGYTISATATDDVGTYAAASTVAVSVTHTPPVLSIAGPSTATEGVLYSLTLSASDPGHTLTGWVINWGDGSSQTYSGSATSASHTYATGVHTYQISAAASDDVGGYSAGGLYVTVAHVPPVLSIAGAANAAEGSPYTLTLSGTDGAGHAISDWVINWGDGDIQTLAGDPNSASHTYALGPSTYTISATATDDVSTYTVPNDVSVLVGHVAPTLTLSGNSTVNEGGLYTLALASVETAGHTLESWSINWGDGDTQPVAGNLSSVTHTYALGPNTYTVSATATDDVGTYAAANSIVVAVAHVPPTLAIAGSSTVDEGQTYTLSLSASDPGHTISAWLIFWGDNGQPQAVAGDPSSVTHTYPDGPATYQISAIAVDDVSGYTAPNTVTVNVAHVAPTVSASGAAAVNELAPYTLNLSAVEAVAGHTVGSWTINWGDGDTQNVSGNPGSITHTYAAPGTYTISPAAVDDVASYAATPLSVLVNKVAPTLTLTGSSTGNPGSVYTLSLSGIEHDSDTITGWTINWGDGDSEPIAGTPDSVTHIFMAPENVTITATATDAHGSYSSNSLPVSVQFALPIADAGGPYTVNEGGTVTLTGAASTGNGLTYAWDLNGDGVFGQTGTAATNGDETGATPTFNAGGDGPGVYPVTLQVTDSLGQTSSATALVTVLYVAPTITAVGNATATEAQPYALTLAPLSLPGTDAIDSYVVHWGDGTSNTYTEAGQVSHTFTTAGAATVVVEFTDSQGLHAAAATLNLAVQHAPPAVSISGNSTVNQNAAYTLGLSATAVGSEPITGWTINWGDGTSQTVTGNPSSVSHSFATAGTPTITASAIDALGSYPASPVSVTVAPVVVNNLTAAAPTLPALGSASASFSVAYANAAGVDLAALQGVSVYVTGPNGYQQQATVSSIANSTGTSATLAYQVPAPAAAWTPADNGTYTVFANINGSPQAVSSFNVYKTGTDTAGHTEKAATNLGAVALNATAKFADWINPGNTADYYKVTIPRSGGVTLDADNLTAGVELQWLNSKGKVLSTTTAGAGGTAMYQAITTPGVYYVKVLATGAQGTDYNLAVTNDALPVDRAGSTEKAARNLGTIGPKSKVVVSDSVNPFDTSDFYRLTLAKTAQMTIDLTGLTAGVTVQLLNQAGQIAGSIPVSSDGTAAFDGELSPGVYYLHLQSSGQAWADYQLAIHGSPVAAAISLNRSAALVNIGFSDQEIASPLAA